MTKPQVKIYNCETGEEIVRDATDEEIAQIELDAINFLAKKNKELTEAKAKSDLLKKLGLTEQEAKLLLS